MEKLINILIPVFNEEESIGELIDELSEAVISIDNCSFLVTIVDDGSSDSSWAIIQGLKSSKKISFKKIKLSRNFGHQAAISCGIDSFHGDCILILDSDFQDDPKYIPQMIDAWLNGSKVVLARRTKRDDGTMKNIIFSFFYKLQFFLTDIKLPKNVGHFSVLDKVVVNVLNQMPEKIRYLNGLRAYAGFSPTFIDVKKNKRKYGKTKMSYGNFLNLAFRGLFDYSVKPIRFIGLTGLLIALGSILFSIVVFIQDQFFGIRLFNWDFGLSSIYFLSGLQLLSLSIIGEYVSNIFIEVKKRPTYIIENTIND
jgi:glycosyltransferase involved in cell wall biosynthesis